MKGEPTRIGYVTDDPTPDYNRGLDAAGSPAELRAFLKGWPTLAPDARKCARTLRDDNWQRWRDGLAKERKGEFAGEAWAEEFGDILMPGRMLRTSMVMNQFVVPWGLAWKRLDETGLLDGEAAS